MPRPSAAIDHVKLSQRLGEVVKQARLEMGLTRPALSKRTGLSKSYISYLESGKYVEIGVAKFALLVEALQMSADQLLGEAGYLRRPKTPMPDPHRYLASQFGLDRRQIRSALDYVEFLRSGAEAVTTT
jgi:transcriptional regulator with XRE-family HTH domain